MFQFDVNCFEQQKRKESKFGLKPIYWNVRVGKYQRSTWDCVLTKLPWQKLKRTNNKEKACFDFFQNFITMQWDLDVYMTYILHDTVEWQTHPL